MRGACRLDHRRVDVDADRAAVGADGLGDAPGDRAGAAADVEHGEAGAQQLREPAVIRAQRANIEDLARAVGHVRPASREVAGGRITVAYHERPGGTTSTELRRARAGRP